MLPASTKDCPCLFSRSEPIERGAIACRVRLSGETGSRRASSPGVRYGLVSAQEMDWRKRTGPRLGLGGHRLGLADPRSCLGLRLFVITVLPGVPRPLGCA